MYLKKELVEFKWEISQSLSLWFRLKSNYFLFIQENLQAYLICQQQRI